MHILISLGAVLVGFLIEIYTFQIVRIFGHIGWAEQHMGPGGSYTLWRIIGIVTIIAGYYNLRHPLI